MDDGEPALRDKSLLHRRQLQACRRARHWLSRSSGTMKGGIVPMQFLARAAPTSAPRGVRMPPSWCLRVQACRSR